MNKIWSVHALFEDCESSYWILIGNFTDKLIAESHKKKWLEFFEINRSILEEPKNWNPEKDDWFEPNPEKKWTYHSEFSWYDSSEYYEKISKYRDINNFKDISITEQSLNQDVFIENNQEKLIIDLMREFNRDYKINEIIK